MEMTNKYMVMVPAIHNSCRYNNMKVSILKEKTNHYIVVNKKGKVLCLRKEWLIKI